MAVICLAVYWAGSFSVAAENQTVTARNGSVGDTANGQVNAGGWDSSFDDHVVDVPPTKIQIWSKIFNPPQNWAFKPFNQMVQGQKSLYADVVPGEASGYPLWVQANAAAVQVNRVFDATAVNAGVFPMHVEGNLKPPPGGGGPQDFYWAVRVGTVQIADASNHVLVDSQTTIVGKKIVLKGIVAAAGKVVTAHKWTIGGTRIKGYTQTMQTGEQTELQTDDLNKDNVTFYWIAGAPATSRVEVEYEATIDGTIYSDTVQYEVKRPTATLTSQLTSLTPRIDLRDGFLLLGVAEPFFEGIIWSASVTTTEGGAGQIAFTQLVNTLRHRTLDDASSTKEKWTSGGTYVLDGAEMGIQYGGTTNIGDAATESISKADSPGIPLAGNKKVSMDDKFRVYLMYKPNGEDSIWVTLRLLDWADAGAATKTNETWVLDAGQSSSTGQSSDSNVLPGWEKEVNGLGWVADN